VIADRVKQARLYHGWSQTELAKRVDVPQPKISQLESGMYTSSELVDAIAIVTQYSREWFDKGPLPDLPIGSLRFRKMASSTVRDDERVRAHVRQAVEVLDQFSTLKEVPPVRIQAIRSSSECTSEEIEEIANQTRLQLDVGPDDPIPNLVRALERSGIAVIGSVVDIERHGGASFWPNYPVGRPVICLTKGVSGDRQRLTAAHELGHLILHTLRSVESKIAESEAYRFAGALLIPGDQLRALLTGPVTLKALANVKARWGISIRALVRRCLDLRLINEAQRISLERQISSRKWTQNEPVHVPYEHPMLVKRIIEIATGTTSAKSSRKLGLPPFAIQNLIT
jgi:Zn-dependent peptidase ImmA (M78 family)/transcriptional regulator with XRE-family HTH domain